MSGFNQFYYSFSPIVADLERENPIIQRSSKTNTNSNVIIIIIAELCRY